MKKRRRYRTDCFMCTENVHEVTFRDADVLRMFISGQKKILPRRKTGTCAKHQRQIAREIKRARQMGTIAERGQ